MTDIGTIVIVGASLTGVKAAEALRKEGYDGRIVMFGEEPQPPYLRPPLSKEYLRGESEPDKVFVHPEAWYAEQRIELHVSTPAGPSSLRHGRSCSATDSAWRSTAC